MEIVETCRNCGKPIKIKIHKVDKLKEENMILENKINYLTNNIILIGLFSDDTFMKMSIVKDALEKLNEENKNEKT